MDLVDKLRAVSAEIRERRRFATNEASTRNYLIDPFIRALGYDPNEPKDVEPEFTADFVANNRKVDYALKKEGKPIIFVEFKTATRSLSFQNTVQLQHYFSTKLDVRFGIVTNGLEYRFYSDIDNPNVMDDEPFLIADLLNANDKLFKELSAFSKQGFDLEGGLLKARQLKYGSIIRQRIESEIEQPSRELVKYLARNLYIGSFSGDAFGEFAPIVERELQDLLLSEQSHVQDKQTEFKSDIGSEETPAIRDRIQPFVPSQMHMSGSDIGSRASEPRLIQDGPFESRRLYDKSTMKAKGFYVNNNDEVAAYDAANEKYFWFEDTRLLEETCYSEMADYIIKGIKRQNNPQTGKSELVNVIPRHKKFQFEYEHRGSGRFVITRIL
ncbi:MAG: type I restriction endonuclease [Chloroflexi bacterium]|nr:type I restriction endonuclease [Chloroflexota bacterium]